MYVQYTVLPSGCISNHRACEYKIPLHNSREYCLRAQKVRFVRRVCTTDPLAHWPKRRMQGGSMNLSSNTQKAMQHFYLDTSQDINGMTFSFYQDKEGCLVIV